MLLLRRRWRPPRAAAAAAVTTTAGRGRRALVTLAIETSCDDTAVALLSRTPGGETALLFNQRVASDNRAFRGVHPVVAARGHQAALAGLVGRALAVLERGGGGGGRGRGRGGRDGRGGGRGGRGGGGAARRPDLVAATRGPGQAANLSIGLSLAKGLALAWGVPLVGVHHMQAHALTPQLVHALARTAGGDGGGHGSGSGHGSPGSGSGSPVPGSGSPGSGSSSPGDNPGDGPDDGAAPAFPFLSLLVSGGHTQLVASASLTDHRVVADTADIAVGNLLDQAARAVLPADVLDASTDVMYGRLLENFAFPPAGSGSGSRSAAFSAAFPASAALAASAASAAADDDDDGVAAQHAAFFRPALSRRDEQTAVPTPHGWAVGLPFRDSRRLAFSFSGIYSQVCAIAAARPDMAPAERRDLARHTLRAAFQHVASRLCVALADRPALADGRPAAAPPALVVAGGVAANRFLLHVLRATLAARGLPALDIVVPPSALCTDNAAMVAWAASEMYRAGWHTDLAAQPVARWSLDAAGGGILGVDCWLRRAGADLATAA